jgi:WD40 repeat protein
MIARALSVGSTGLLVILFGTAVLASDPSPKPAGPTGKLPDGVVARLGDTRLRHAAPVTCITFSPDSRHIITGGQDQRLRVWDVRSGSEIRCAEVSYIPLSLRFTDGGARLAVAAGYGSLLRFLDPETLAETGFATGANNEVALSANGKLVATVSTDHVLTVSEVETGLPMLELPMQSTTGCRSAFLPDGKSIAIADRAGKVTLYKVAGGKPLLSLDHGGPINGLAVSRDGEWLATGGEGPEGSLKIWELNRNGNGNKPKPVAEIDGVSRPRAWFGNDRVAAAGPEGAGVYDIKEKKWTGFARGVGEEWAVSPDEKYIASAGTATLRVRIWDLETGKQLHAENDSFPNAALLSPTSDGKSLFILAGEAAYHWPVGKREAAPAGKLPAPAIIAATGGGRLAVATPSDVLIYDGFDPKERLGKQPDRRLGELVAGCRAVALSADGRRVAYSGEPERIVIADAATGKTIRILPSKTIGLGLAFSGDGSKLAVAGRDGYLRLWPIDSAVGEESDVWRVRLQRAPRAAVAFNADSSLVAVTSATMIKVVNAATGEVIAQLDRREIDDGVFQQVAFSPDSRLIVTGSAGLSGAVHVYEIKSRKLVRRLTTSMGSIHSLAVFPDGTRAATAGAEEVITVWDLADLKSTPK